MDRPNTYFGREMVSALVIGALLLLFGLFTVAQAVYLDQTS